MAKAQIIHNSSCLCCKKVEPEMVMVGPMVFCNSDFKSEFVDVGLYNEETGEVDSQCKEYKKWLKEYKSLV